MQHDLRRYLPRKTAQLVCIGPELDQVVDQGKESGQGVDRREEEDVTKLAKRVRVWFNNI